MKKNLTQALLMMCLSSFQLFAQQEDKTDPQQTKHELRMGYGVLSDMQLIAAFSDTYTTVVSGITGEPIDSKYPAAGPFIGSFTFFVSKHIALGPEINLMQLNINNTYSSGEVTRDCFFITNLSARVDFYYAQNEKIELYSGASLGGTYIFEQSLDPDEEDNSAPFVSYHLNFFGIRYGKSWAGYAEVGFGRNGLINFGISRRL